MGDMIIVGKFIIETKDAKIDIQSLSENVISAMEDIKGSLDKLSTQVNEINKLGREIIENLCWFRILITFVARGA